MIGFRNWLKNLKKKREDEKSRKYWKTTHGYTDAQYDRLKYVVDNDYGDDSNLPRVKI